MKSAGAASNPPGSFPRLFHGMIDSAAGDQEPEADPGQERVTKQAVPVAVKTSEQKPPALPFSFTAGLIPLRETIQSADADQASAHDVSGDTAAVQDPGGSDHSIRDRRGKPLPAAPVTPRTPSTVEGGQPVTANVSLVPVVQIAGPNPPSAGSAAAMPVTPDVSLVAAGQIATANAPPAPAALPGPQPAVSQSAPPPAQRAPEQAGGSPWKQVPAALPGAELAFATRVTLTEASGESASTVKSTSEQRHAVAVSNAAFAVAAKADTPDAGTNPGEQENNGDPSAPSQQAAVKTASASQHKTGVATFEQPSENLAEPSVKASAASPQTAPQTGAQQSAARSDEPAKEVSKPAQSAPAADAPWAAEKAPAAPAAPLRDISLRLSGGDQDKLEVKVVQAAGEVRVAVRSADPQLTASLQQGLGELVGKLESRGMRAETWKPSGEVSGSAQPARSEPGNSGQQQSSGDGSPGRQWREQQQEQQVVPPRRQNKPDWLREIDNSFDTLPTDMTRRTA